MTLVTAVVGIERITPGIGVALYSLNHAAQQCRELICSSHGSHQKRWRRIREAKTLSSSNYLTPFPNVYVMHFTVAKSMEHGYGYK